MKSLHPRQKITAALYLFLAMFFVSILGIYGHARSRSVLVGCWGPSERIVSLPSGVPNLARHAFSPLAEVDGWISGEPIVIQVKSR